MGCLNWHANIDVVSRGYQLVLCAGVRTQGVHYLDSNHLPAYPSHIELHLMAGCLIWKLERTLMIRTLRDIQGLDECQSRFDITECFWV